MNQSVFGETGLTIVFLYLGSLLIIGWLANRSRRDNSIKDFYLAGSSLGFTSLFFTLYATQYSGNTLLALPGKAYRTGLTSLGVMFAVMAVAMVYAAFAPRLNQLAKQHRFITVGDFISWRYQSKHLRLLVNIVLVITLVSYALGNFKAVGLLLESASGGLVSFSTAIVSLAFIMAIYESMGGMRAVVWTDIIQGLLLMIGCLIIFAGVSSISEIDSVTRVEGFLTSLNEFVAEQAQFSGFFSLILLIGVGAAVYPQAIQRIYAAKNEVTMRRSYRLMFFMPLLTTLPMILVGISVSEWMPSLDKQQSEQVVIFAIQRVVEAYPAMSWLMILCIAAALAAIMSTIDSALLSLGSTVTSDFLGPYLKQLDDNKARRVSRIVSWLLMAVMAMLAIVLPQTIWALMVFKFELLIQLAPAIILGVRSQTLRTDAVMAGLLAGVLVAVVMKISVGTALGVHAGVWGLFANLLVIFAVQRCGKPADVIKQAT
ncbi:MAG: Na+/proline symporter [Phenylobacterium sp.]